MSESDTQPLIEVSRPGPDFYWRRGAAVVVVFAVFAWLYAVNGYATGYMQDRATLWHDMQAGYRRDGGEWGFGWFILPAIALLAWLTRERFRGLPIEPAMWSGGLLLAFGFFLYFGGYKANEKYVGFAAGQLLAAGVMVFFLGWGWFRRAFWLWCLLGLLWPWRFLIDPISFPLQLVMVKFTGVFLHLIGDPATTSGTEVHTTRLDPVTGEAIRLNVAATCSGLRSLFALTMVGIVYGYLALKESWKRIVLLAAVPFLAIAGNFCRMIMLYYGAIFMGSKRAIGEGEHDPSAFHLGAGILVFVVALGGMLVIVQVLREGFGSLRRKKTVVRVVETEAPTQ